jgi:eukaryotic-like serine/threonine-protein kinase
MSQTRNWHPAPQALAEFSLGKLPEDEMAVVSRHLGVCAECRRQVDHQPPDTFIRRVQAAAPPSGSVEGTVFTPPPSASVVAGAKELAVGPADTPPELLRSEKYQILGKLGQGGMGAVYKAKHVSMARTVAIKVMSPDMVGDTDAVRRFKQEVKAAAQLSHPNIVTAYDHDQAGDLHFLVMEYIEGMSLQRYVDKHGPPAFPLACQLVRQAALALQHAHHEREMVHRDIKPQNLMVTRKGLVKVLDFGLARLPRQNKDSRGGTAINMFMGTPEYVAPEQAMNAREADIRADIYSLGCTLYFLLSGTPPFRKGNTLDTLTAHRRETPPPLKPRCPELPDQVEALVMRMLAKEPADRPQTPGEVARALEPFIMAGKKGAALDQVPEPGEAPEPEGSETQGLHQGGRDTYRLSVAGAASPVAPGANSSDMRKGSQPAAPKDNSEQALAYHCRFLHCGRPAPHPCHRRAASQAADFRRNLGRGNQGGRRS